jgi:hypothetical protein
MQITRLTEREIQAIRDRESNHDRKAYLIKRAIKSQHQWKDKRWHSKKQAWVPKRLASIASGLNLLVGVTYPTITGIERESGLIPWE